MIKRALVIGSGGQVARALISELQKRKVEVLLTSSSGKAGAFHLDLSKPESIRTAVQEAWKKFGKGEVEVFLPGAMTHVDNCEKEKEHCRAVNEVGPRVVAEESKALDWGLTYFSTEYVFGGDEYQGGRVGPFREEDAPHPTSWYGECKLRAEEAIQRVYGKEGALLVRTTMVFSWDPTGMNFLMQYLRHMDQVSSGESSNIFRIPEDQISTPTYAPALAEATCDLRDKNVGGVINLVGADLLSRRELVERVIHAFGYDREKCLRGFTFLKTKDLGQSAKRPLTAGLTTEKARKLGARILTLEQAFENVKKLRA